MRWRSTAVVVSAIALSLGGGLAANAADGPSKAPQAAGVPASNRSSSSEVGMLTLPPVSEEMSELASELSGKLAGDPNFASVEVTRKRDLILVYWHGAQSRELLDTIERRPSVPVEIRPTQHAPSMLKAKAASVAQSDATVGSIGLKHDGSGLLVALKESPESGWENAAASSRFSTSLGVPVEVASDAAPVPANSRQFDVNYPYVGQEICYSGSFSGLKCGNIVQQVDVRYELGGDLTDIKGFRTQHSNGEPAVGN